ncbi:SDR family oxidoreductase [Agaribacter marinus]|uniref:Short-chain dehydrogenase n=1 Tax=Agaribacter marinus TaxID=1431249 RepID=A0AA37T1P5_9ALTE|nr:SDR family oxidoreductase [Agaribacter marinus]GLR71966.1 short-chain dehydrogenase [Agaribacter marinus]
MNTFIENKTIIITGASQGIGHATALYLARHGANLVLISRNQGKLAALQSNIQTNGGNAIYVQGDVADYRVLQKAVNCAHKHFSQVDVLINNAGTINPIERLAESDVTAWSKVVDTNIKGVYHGIRAVIPAMLQQGRGIIINISSGAATSALEGWSHYCSTKAAVLSLTRCVHKEYARHGVRVIGLSPGTVATEMQTTIRESGINPVSKLDWSAHIPANWVAKAIAFLMSDDAAELAGDDFSLKHKEGRVRAGLPV